MKFTLDVTTKEFLDVLMAQGGPPLYKVPVAVARAMAVIGQARFPVQKPEVCLQDLDIELRTGCSVPIRIVRPPRNHSLLPAVMYFHGGGWIVNDRDTHDRLIREIAVAAEAAVVFVEYTRSPEARYPTAIEEAYAATLWVAEHGAELNVDPARIAVMGDSAGGNMAAAVTMLAKQRCGPHLCGQVLFYPTTDCDFTTSSYQQFGKGHFLTTEDMQWFWSQYAPDESMRTQPTAALLKATKEQLSGLPPALIVTAECDVVRDEAEAYARQLALAGVEVTATRYLGAIHGFTFLNALADTSSARAAVAQATGILRNHFFRHPRTDTRTQIHPNGCHASKVSAMPSSFIEQPGDGPRVP